MPLCHNVLYLNSQRNIYFFTTKLLITTLKDIKLQSEWNDVTPCSGNTIHFRLRYFGHTVWKEIEENAEILWNIYKDMNEKRKVRQYLLRKLRKKL